MEKVDEVYAGIFIRFCLLAYGLYAYINVSNKVANKPPVRSSLLLFLIFIALFVNVYGALFALHSIDAIVAATATYISSVFDMTKFVLNTTGLGYKKFDYGTLLGYTQTEHKWGCGSTVEQIHVIGLYSSLWFPANTLDAINSCCRVHDADYCCQIGREVADYSLHMCIQKQCDMFETYEKYHHSKAMNHKDYPAYVIEKAFCELGVEVYRYLVETLAQPAYDTATEDIHCDFSLCA